MLHMRACTKQNQQDYGNEHQREVSFTPIKKERVRGNKIANENDDFFNEGPSTTQFRKWNEQQKEIVVVQVWAGK